QITVLGQDVHVPAEPATWAGLLGFGVIQMIVYWLVYEGFGKGQLAVLNPVFASYSGIVALISIVALGEAPHLLPSIGLVAVFGGIILLNTDTQGLHSKKMNIVPGLAEVGSAAILAAIWTIGWDRFVSGQDALSYAMFMYAFMSLAAFALAKLMKVKLRGMPPQLWKFLFLIGAGETLAYLAITWGFGATSLTSVVALISGAFSLPTVILAYIFLKERISALQIGAVGIIIAGIILVSL
ncbi:MAG TPA: EamA family transporter, partial [Candidatus Saccharimonadales bacterium]|nr:EamA family transporter [Candidatus Saccharimonadales bacterium]